MHPILKILNNSSFELSKSKGRYNDLNFFEINAHFDSTNYVLHYHGQIKSKKLS